MVRKFNADSASIAISRSWHLCCEDVQKAVSLSTLKSKNKLRYCQPLTNMCWNSCFSFII